MACQCSHGDRSRLDERGMRRLSERMHAQGSEESEDKSKVMEEARERVLDLISSHEELLLSLRLTETQKAWLRCSVVNCYLLMLSSLQHIDQDLPAALQVCLCSLL